MQHTSEPTATRTHIPNTLCGYAGEYHSLPGGEPDSTSKNQSQLNHHIWDHSLEINPMQCSIWPLSMKSRCLGFGGLTCFSVTQTCSQWETLLTCLLFGFPPVIPSYVNFHWDKGERNQFPWYFVKIKARAQDWDNREISQNSYRSFQNFLYVGCIRKNTTYLNLNVLTEKTSLGVNWKGSPTLHCYPSRDIPLGPRHWSWLFWHLCQQISQPEIHNDGLKWI